MVELWIKKTIYRRCLIEDDDIKAVQEIMDKVPEEADEIIQDIYDRNKELEYDNEEIIIPIKYIINKITDTSGGE